MFLLDSTSILNGNKLCITLLGIGVILCTFFVQLVNSLLVSISICSPMGITGDGLMTALAVGAATVHQTTVPLTQHGGLGRAVSASQLDAGDTLCSLTPWCRYIHIFKDFSPLQENTENIFFKNL